MTLSIIIVSWNVQDKLRENLNALFKSIVDFDFEVIVFDNNSEDGTPEMVKSKFPQVHLVESRFNIGFGAANNQVMKDIESEYILLLNPDMRVGKHALQYTIDWMKKNEKATVAGCMLVTEVGEIIKHVRRFPRLWDQLAIVLKIPHIFKSVLKRYILADFDFKKAQAVDSVRGGYFMINKKRVSDLKQNLNSTLPLFDEKYFLWFEEVDYCRQIYEAGGEVWYTPDAKCIDFVGQSFKQLRRREAQRYFKDSMLKYFKKWHPYWQYLILKLAWPIGKLLAVTGEKVGIKR